jgi:hypothetical protein
MGGQIMREEMACSLLSFLQKKRGIVFDGPLVREFSEHSGYPMKEVWRLVDVINENGCQRKDIDLDHVYDTNDGIGHA